MDNVRKGDLILKEVIGPNGESRLVGTLQKVFPSVDPDRILALLSKPKPFVLIEGINETQARKLMEMLQALGATLEFVPTEEAPAATASESQETLTQAPPVASPEPPIETPAPPPPTPPPAASPRVQKAAEPSEPVPPAGTMTARRKGKPKEDRTTGTGKYSTVRTSVGRVRIALLSLLFLATLAIAFQIFVLKVNPFHLILSAFNNGSPGGVDGELKVERYGYPEIVLPHNEIQNAFFERDFSRLNSILDGYQRSMNEDFHYEYAVHNSYAFFNNSDISQEAIFPDWVQTTPESYVPFVAQGAYYLTRAWDARGQDLAKDTTEEQFQRTREYAEKAEESLLKALEINPKAFRAFTTMIHVKQLHGGIPANVQVVQQSLSLYPESFLIRQFFIETLIPRWGGSYELMDLFAKEAQEYVDKNPKLRLLYGFSHYDRGKMSWRNRLVDQATEHYTKALTYGKLSPWLDARARCYIQKEMYLKALDDLNRSIARYPKGTSARLMRAYIREMMHDLEGAADDLIEASHSNRKDEEVTRLSRRMADMIGEKVLSLSNTAPDEAMSLIEKSLKLAPESIKLNIRRNTILLKTDQRQIAYEEIASLIISNGKNLGVHSIVAQELAQARFNAPSGFWDYYCKKEPKDPGGFLYRGLAASWSGNSGKGLNDLAKAALLAPGNRDVYNTIYQQFQGTMKSESPLKFWEGLLDKQPDNALAYYYQGVARIGSGDTDGAKGDFMKACELDLDWGCNRYQYLTSGKAATTASTPPSGSGRIIPFSKYDSARYYLECGNQNRVLRILNKRSR